MPYTLAEFIDDCRSALRTDAGPRGRDLVKELVQKATRDDDFVAANIPLDQQAERRVIHEDPDFGFCVVAHVYRDAKSSSPHDHGPSWAIYGQASGVTEMTDYEVVDRSHDGQPGKASSVRVYSLTPGLAHVYNEGDLHAPSRAGATRLLRIEGINLLGIRRDAYRVVER